MAISNGVLPTKLVRMPSYIVSLAELRSIVDPLDGTMWQCGPIFEQEVLEALSSGADEQRIWENVIQEVAPSERRTFHINRIATLLKKNTNADGVILVLENHLPKLTAYLNDGNHRLAAAYIRGDETARIVIAASAPDKVTDTLKSAVKVA